MGCYQRSRAGLCCIVALLVWHSCTVPATAQAQPRGPAVAPAAQLSSFAPADCRSIEALTAQADVCGYVREHCSGGSVIPYVQLYYCYVRPAGLGVTILFQAACALWLALLFRALGSTAESFFSPILTQLSQEMGLPPRLAGVTFLALGNGAPDISSSIAAIASSNFEMALGALLGGGLFVGGIVAGMIMLGNGGAKARGALLRDVSAYCASVIVLTAFLGSGAMTYARSIALLILDAAFVLIVLGADLWHIFTRNAEAEKAPETEPLLLEGAVQAGRQSQPLIPPAADLYPSTSPEQQQQQQDHVTDSTIEMTEKQHSTGSAPLGMDDLAEQHRRAFEAGAAAHREVQEAMPHHRVHRWLQNADGGMQPMPLRKYRAHALAELSQSATFDHRERARERRRGSMEAEALERAEQEQPPDAALSPGYRPPTMVEQALPGHHQHHPDAGHEDEEQEMAELGAAGNREPGGGQPARAGEAGDGGSAGDSVVNVGRFRRVLTRCRSQLDRASPALARLERAAECAEWPLTVARRASVPLLEQEFYSRPWFLASLVGGPLFAMWYLRLLSWTALGSAAAAGCLAAAFAAWATRGTGGKAPVWSLGLRFPVGAAAVAAAGFVVAAMWIDTLASELVAMLEYLGLLSGINHTVLGLTVLAWGNSVGDMSTNLAMARKGLANMAMTACYAGPVFNLLVGAAVGFMRLLARRGAAAVQVDVTANVVLSCACVVLMCVGIVAVGLANRGHLPASFGWYLIGLYIVYVVVSVVLVVI